VRDRRTAPGAVAGPRRAGPAAGSRLARGRVACGRLVPRGRPGGSRLGRGRPAGTRPGRRGAGQARDPSEPGRPRDTRCLAAGRPAGGTHRVPGRRPAAGTRPAQDRRPGGNHLGRGRIRQAEDPRQAGRLAQEDQADSRLARQNQADSRLARQNQADSRLARQNQADSRLARQNQADSRLSPEDQAGTPLARQNQAGIRQLREVPPGSRPAGGHQAGRPADSPRAGGDLADSRPPGRPEGNYRAAGPPADSRRTAEGRTVPVRPAGAGLAEELAASGAGRGTAARRAGGRGGRRPDTGLRHDPALPAHRVTGRPGAPRTRSARPASGRQARTIRDQEPRPRLACAAAGGPGLRRSQSRTPRRIAPTARFRTAGSSPPQARVQGRLPLAAAGGCASRRHHRSPCVPSSDRRGMSAWRPHLLPGPDRPG
jgi:hypothetical protein